MEKKTLSRQSLTVIIFFLYLLPTFFLVIYNQPDFYTLSLGLLTSVCGSIILFLLIHSWQSNLQTQRLAPVPNQVASIHVPEPTCNETESPHLFVKPLSSLPDKAPRELSPLPPPKEETKKQEDNSHLIDELQSKTEEIQKLQREKNQIHFQLEKLQQEAAKDHRNINENLLSKEKLQGEYLQTISDQRAVIERQEDTILKLEGQIHDLTYEIKTLVQLNDSHLQHSPFSPFYDENQPSSSPDNSNHSSETIPSPLFHSENQPKPYYRPASATENRLLAPAPIEADLQLRRCINIAQKTTGTNMFGGEASRFRDLSINSYSIDLRCLLDNLRSENSSTILLYSLKEDKLLFVNNHAKNLLGWSPEKFTQDFPSLIQTSLNDWKQALIKLTSKSETQVRLLMKNKAGQEVPVECHLGVIPTGVFRSHIIGVLFAAA